MLKAFKNQYKLKIKIKYATTSGNEYAKANGKIITIQTERPGIISKILWNL
ncbi:MAG: hypothetical protein Q7S53_00040 [bacterium]|nr:hypothetical protein [bacterium]